MMMTGISHNAQAILLLTAPLIIGKGSGRDSVRPLSLVEYNKLAKHLCRCECEPADLLGRDARAILDNCQIEVEYDRILRLLERGFVLSQALEHWQSRAIWVISRADPTYPTRYKKRLGKLAPLVLYGCGNAGLLENGGLAVVGSRNVPDELIDYTKQIGRLAAEVQCTVISGGARGIDHAAMSGALSEWGTVVGVLDNRLERAALDRGNRDALMDDRLVLVSPYDPKAGFNVGNAMQRNKLIYALADASLVVESDIRKGGTWAGAVEQLAELHLTPIYTRSEGEIGKGLKALLGKGALPWPNPKTVDAFQAVIAGELPPQTEVHTQALMPITIETDDTLFANRKMLETPAVYTLEPASPSALSASDALFAKAEDLLELIGYPINEASVAEYLGITKAQAKAWLNRLVESGVYIKKTRPVRYERKPLDDSNSIASQLL